MPTDEEWRTLIIGAMAQRAAPIIANEYRRDPVRQSFAAPPLLACEDGAEYWVKSISKDSPLGAVRNDHASGMINDQILGRVARKLHLEAVPSVALIEIPDSLIAIERRLEKVAVNLAHGSLNAATSCTDRLDFDHGGYCRQPINRSRVAGLAVFYGLAVAQDHQVIYRLSGDPLVFSVDHGHFFPHGPNWRPEHLDAVAGGAIDLKVVTDCGLTPRELAEPLRRLSEFTAEGIAECVAAPPDEWLFTEIDRIAVARFLWRRRDAILASVP
jgi:hypothetical protein